MTEIEVVSADVPVVCRDTRRTFVWMPLDKQGTLAPSRDPLRIASPTEESAVPQPDRVPEPVPDPQTNRERKKADVTKPSGKGSVHGDGVAQPQTGNDAPEQPGNAGLGSLIEETQALKETLRSAFGRACRLVVALQRQRKHSKLFQTALTSLRQLQQLDP